jgi:hypothetical protein
MPNGIYIIMKKSTHLFDNIKALTDLIDAYFEYIEGKYHLEKKPPKKPADQTDTEQKVWDREPEPATITGLALFLGFNSKDEFNTYESKGKYASAIKRARLRVETTYEKKLHYQSPTGAIFALKSMGWNEKPEAIKPADKIKNIKVKIIDSGPQPACSEKEVIL